MMSHHLNVHLEYKDIEIAHRLGKYIPNKNRAVIVKFVRRQTKIDVMKRAKQLKGTGIYINEDLTKINAEVLASLRLKEPSHFERAWSHEGKLFVRYNGIDRNEHVDYKQNQNWLSKPWPQKETTTYAKKAASTIPRSPKQI
ncbi:hypothetical protein DPMN_155825 [Dreissena polymorpha]|uniref:Uncharacterized protein n=1 Tax=Dreissena polymorpha TaxID=45954 RepID=A0A9D4FR39_DREPO|nr:hypothetical protein DPMN_155825 [Dreissena polymorpha]